MFCRLIRGHILALLVLGYAICFAFMFRLHSCSLIRRMTHIYIVFCPLNRRCHSFSDKVCPSLKISCLCTENMNRRGAWRKIPPKCHLIDCNINLANELFSMHPFIKTPEHDHISRLCRILNISY